MTAYTPAMTLPDMNSITQYCRVEDIETFLQMISESITSDRDRIIDWKRTKELLVASIEQTRGPLLKAIHESLNQIELERFLLISSVNELHRSCTEYRDILSSHVMNTVLIEMDAAGYVRPMVPFALISMGSDGRKEQTLITDQDNLIVYGDDGGETADYYFNELSSRLVGRYLIKIFHNSELIDMIRTMEHEYFQVLWGMAKAATEMKLALGFMKRIWTESSGEHNGEFNIKLLAWAPLVMNVRILAINQCIPATSTLERISLLESEGSFSPSFTRDLVDAYHVLTKHRILIQIRSLKGIQSDSHYLNPYQLSTTEREQIRRAMIKIEDLQKIIHTNFHIV